MESGTATTGGGATGGMPKRNIRRGASKDTVDLSLVGEATLTPEQRAEMEKDSAVAVVLREALATVVSVADEHLLPSSV